MGKPRRASAKQEGFSGGMVSVGDPSTLAPNQFSNGGNLRLTPTGGLEARRGSRRVLTSPPWGGTDEVSVGRYWWFENQGNNTNVVLAGGVGGYRVYTGGAEPGSVWGDHGATTFDRSDIMVEFRDGTNDCMYFGGSDGLHKFTPGVQLVKAIANARGTFHTLAVHNNRLFAASGSTLYWSSLGNGDTLGYVAGGGGAAVVRTAGDDTIMALASVGNSLLIFHRDAISIFTGWSIDDISIATGTRGLSSTVGCVGKNAVAVWNNVAYFMSQVGPMACTEAELTFIGRPIETFWRNISATEYGLLGETRVVYNPTFDEVQFHQHIGTENVCYAYNPSFGVWSGLHTIPRGAVVPVWLSRNPSTGKYVVLVGQAGGVGNLLHLDYGGASDNLTTAGAVDGGSVGILSSVVSRTFDFGDPHSDKGARYLYVDGNWDANEAEAALYSLNYADGSEFLPLPPARRTVGIRDKSFYAVVNFSGGGTTIDSLELEAFVYTRRN